MPLYLQIVPVRDRAGLILLIYCEYIIIISIMQSGTAKKGMKSPSCRHVHIVTYHLSFQLRIFQSSLPYYHSQASFVVPNFSFNVLN